MATKCWYETLNSFQFTNEMENWGGVMDVNIILEGGYACVNHLRTGGGKKSGIFANII